MVPMLMIYPPQPEAVAFSAVSDAPDFVKLDRFDEELVSYDGMLALNIDENVRIIMQDGAEFQLFGQSVQDALANRAMMVFYSVTTRSIPAQTTPELVVVLYETAVHPIAVIDPIELPVTGDDWLAALPATGTPVDLVVQGNIVDTVPLELTENGIIMVPLYLVNTLFKVTLEWESETQTVNIGNFITLTIGLDEYRHETREAVISLGAAPAIIGDRTHVPLAFFTDVIGLNNAYFFEGQIVIDNYEKME
jgi:hypothetical protein